MVDAGHNDAFLFILFGEKDEAGIFMGGSPPGPTKGAGGSPPGPTKGAGGSPPGPTKGEGGGEGDGEGDGDGDGEGWLPFLPQPAQS